MHLSLMRMLVIYIRLQGCQPDVEVWQRGSAGSVISTPSGRRFGDLDKVRKSVQEVRADVPRRENIGLSHVSEGGTLSVNRWKAGS